MVDDTKKSNPAGTKASSSQLPSFRTIEAEGRQAADELAQEILRETLSRGGRLDLDRFARAGPAVQAAYHRHLLAAAMSPPEIESKAAATRVEMQSSRPLIPTPKALLAAPPIEPRSMPRTEVGWRDRQCADIGFASHALRFGIAAAAIIGTVVVLATRVLHL